VAAKRARIEPYLKRLYGYAYSLAGDRHRAEDLVQECAIRALAAKNAPADEPAYRAWLFRILRNAFYDRRRRERIAAEVPDDGNFSGTLEYWQGDERFISVLTVKLEMAKLPPQQREILALIDIVGLSYAEAAGFLKVPVGTIMSRISRARRVLLAAVTASNVHELRVARKKGTA